MGTSLVLTKMWKWGRRWEPCLSEVTVAPGGWEWERERRAGRTWKKSKDRLGLSGGPGHTIVLSTGDGGVGMMFKNMNSAPLLHMEGRRAWGEGGEFSRQPERAVGLTLGQRGCSRGREH